MPRDRRVNMPALIGLEEVTRQARSDPELSNTLGLLRRKIKHLETPEDYLEHRIDFVYGEMRRKHEISREEVREILIRYG